MSAVYRAILLCSSIAACSADVVTDYNVQINYSDFKTYLFASTSANNTISLDSARVERAITSELHNKGLKPTNEKADLTIRHYIQQQSDFRSYGTTFGFGYGYRNVGVAFSSPSQIHEYKYGKLVVELIENSNNSVVWRAVSQRKLTETMTASSREKFIDEQIAEMFKTYPPQKH